MNPHESIVLLPCHALSDFPYHHEGEAAADLLAAYTALWHPALLSGAARMPVWRSAYLDSMDLGQKLVVLPRVCAQDLPGRWIDEARAQGALLIEAQEPPSREALVEEAARLLGRPIKSLPSGLEADFYSLGLCHLLLELLTVQMRYSSLIEEELFSRHLIGAADAAMEGDEDTAREKLAICFDALNQSRSHFYPVDCYLLDLTLVATTTLGRSLRHELARGTPLSLLIEGAVVEAMARQEPQTAAALREAVAGQWACLVGGELDWSQLPLLPIEQILGNFTRGLQAHETVLGARPRIFGRRRAGLSPLLPQLLEKLNFSAALHFTLDDGRFPQSRQSLFRWEGNGAIAIDTLSRIPLDAARHESILSFPQHMSTAMDMDHVAIVAFAHWPAATSIFYDDLRRSAAYGAAVGRFVTLETLLREAEVSGQLARFTADEYRTPYLPQQVTAGEGDPISTIQRGHAAQAERDASDAIATLAAVVRGRWNAAAALPSPTTATPSDTTPSDTTPTSGPTACSATEDLAAALPRSSSPSTAGFLVVNPHSFTRRVVVQADALVTPPAETAPVISAREAHGRKEVIVEVPPMGYAWIASQTGTTWRPPDGKPMVEGLLLRNEFCEVVLSEKTGGVHSLMTPGVRGNRLSQQIAWRQPGQRPQAGESWKDGDETAFYSTMVADRIEISENGPSCGEITSRGRLLDATGEVLAEYSQRTRLVRGTSVVWLHLEVQPVQELPQDPWQNYLAARFAWADDTAELFRGIGLVSERTDARRIESPHFVEIRSAANRTTILAGGLPYHRRSGGRGLDTLLAVRGETCRQFRLGIGLDLKHPQPAALECCTPAQILSQLAAPPKLPSAWLFHVDAKNVVATHWEPIATAEGQVRGVRVRLLETAGRAVACGVSAFRPLCAARQVDLTGGPLRELQADGEKVIIDMAPGEWMQLEVEWS